MLPAVLLLTAPAAGAGEIDLARLGYGDGQTLTAGASSREVFVPIPEGVRSARLRAVLRFSPALDGDSALTIRLGGTPVATVMPRNGVRRTLTREVPARLLERDFLRVGFAGNLAINRDPCADNARPAVWARVAPETAVRFRGGGPATGIGTIWRNLLDRATVAIPASPTLSEMGATLRIMAALHRRGITPDLVRGGDAVPAPLPDIVVGTPRWTEAERVAAGEGALAVLRHRAEQPDGRVATAIRVRGRPAAARLVAEHAQLLANQAKVASASMVAPPDGGAPEPEHTAGKARLNFADIGHPTTTHSFTGRDSFTVRLPLSAVPSGMVPTGLVLSGRGPALGDNEAMMANVFVNGQYAESTRMEARAALREEAVPIAPELLGRMNTIRVGLQRLALTPACERGVTSTFQLHGGSLVTLAEGEYDPQRLQDWVVRHDERLRIVVPERTDVATAVLPGLARVIANAAPPAAGLRVAHTRRAGADSPFIHVTPDPGEAYERVPVAVDRGRVTIATEDGQRLRFRPGTAYSLVELVRRNGAWGLWVVPGETLDFPADAELGTGDVVLFDGSGDALALNTRARKTTVSYPETTTWREYLSRYRGPLFVAFWVLLTVAVAAAVIRMRRRWGSES